MLFPPGNRLAFDHGDVEDNELWRAFHGVLLSEIWGGRTKKGERIGGGLALSGGDCLPDISVGLHGPKQGRVGGIWDVHSV